MRKERYTESELDIREFIGFAKEHVGEKNTLMFRNDFDKSGMYEILDFEEDGDPRFEYHYWRHEEALTPDSAVLGYYKIRLTETKFYNGRTFWFPVSAYVQDNKEGWVIKTKALYISSTPRENGKMLRAYSFPIIDFRKEA